MQSFVRYIYAIVLTFPFVNLLMYQRIQFWKLFLDEISKLKSELQPLHLATAHTIAYPLVEVHRNLNPEVNI